MYVPTAFLKAWDITVLYCVSVKFHKGKKSWQQIIKFSFNLFIRNLVDYSSRRWYVLGKLCHFLFFWTQSQTRFPSFQCCYGWYMSSCYILPCDTPGPPFLCLLTRYRGSRRGFQGLDKRQKEPRSLNDCRGQSPADYRLGCITCIGQWM